MWASSLTATGPNGCASNTAGTLTSAGYTQPFSYDTLDRLSSNDVGRYSYGSGLQETGTTGPLHAAVALVGRGYTATYDASGNMVCRAPNSTLTCAGRAPTGQQLGYDAAGRLTSWQDQTGNPPNVAVTYAYDGEGAAGMIPLATRSTGPSTRSPDSRASGPTCGREIVYSCRSLVIRQPPGAVTLFAGRSIQA